MWSKEAITTRNWLKRYAPTDVPEVVARALAGLKDENGRSVLYMIADCDAFQDVKKQIFRERDEQIHNHLRDVVLAPRKCELCRARRAGRALRLHRPPPPPPPPPPPHLLSREDLDPRAVHLA